MVTPELPVTGARHRGGAGNACKRVYVSTLLAMLPLLVSAGSRVSRGMRAETDHLPEGFSFAVRILGTGQACAAKKKPSGGWRRLPKDASVDYAIEFRDVDYAFDVFSGGMSLQEALAARLFCTRGPNSDGVALTYLFSRLLRAFFFWRAAYRG